MMNKSTVFIFGLLTLAFFLVSCVGGTSIGEAKKTVDPSTAVKSGAQAAELRCPKCPPQVVKPKCPSNCLRDYEILAAARKGSDIQGLANDGSFNVNGDYFTLLAGQSRNLDNGAIVVLNSALIQDYAGGFRGVNFKLDGACQSNFKFDKAGFTTTADQSGGADIKIGDFSVTSINGGLSPVEQTDDFTLDVGETKVLRDGSKIILKETLSQDFASGSKGVVFELICS